MWFVEDIHPSPVRRNPKRRFRPTRAEQIAVHAEFGMSTILGRDIGVGVFFSWAICYYFP